MNLCSCLFLLTRYFVVYCILYIVLSMEIKDTCLSAPSLNSGMAACKGGRFQTFNCLTSQVLLSAKVALFVSLLDIPTPCTVPFSAEEAGSIHICEFYVKLLSLLLLQSKIYSES